MGDSTRHLTLDEVVEIIRANTIPEPNSGCLLWEGGIQHVPVSKKPRHGFIQYYGGIRLRGKMAKVHRVMYEAAHGPIPEGGQILHRCDVRLCCNPDHLFLGTNEDNHADKAAKDRGRKRLTHAKAKEIRAMAASGVRLTRIAAQFSVHPGTVSKIVSGRRRMATFGVT